MASFANLAMAVLGLALGATACCAEPAAESAPILALSPPLKRHSVMVFAGQYTRERFGKSLNPFAISHESNYILAASARSEFLRLKYGPYVAVEGGAGVRFGDSTSGEVWSGLVVGHSGLVLFDKVRVAPSVSTGFSAVTGLIGREAERGQVCCDRNGKLLFHMGVELAFALKQKPDFELVYALHHRSGYHGSLGGFGEGSNANIVGLRRRF